jgi:tetratricopeptide (TPR) repeat protein
MKRILFDRLVRRLVCLAVVALMVVVFAGSYRTAAQTRQLSLADILIALRSKKALAEEKNRILTDAVKERGITFTLTTEIEKELGTTGAQPTLIAAIREKNTPVKVEKKPEPPTVTTPAKGPAPDTIAKSSAPPPPDFAFYRTKASESIKANDLDGALANLAKAADLKPKDPSTYIERGLILMRKEQYDAAIEQFNRATELDPKDFTSRFQLGTIREKLGRIEEAIVDFDKAVAIDPTDESAKSAAARLRKVRSDAVAAAAKPAVPVEPKPIEPPTKVVAEPAVTAPKVLAVASLVDHITRLVKPVYPPMEKRAGFQGIVKALITLDTEGKVTSIKQLDGPKSFWSATEAAIRSSTFKPVMWEGKPVAASGVIAYSFKL